MQWFLPALFWSEVISLAVINKFSRKIGYMVLICCSILASICPVVLPLALREGLVACVFIVIGRLIKENEERVFNKTKWWYFVRLIMVVVLIQLNGNVNLRTGYCGIYPLMVYNAIICTILLWKLCKFLCTVSAIPNFILEIGRESLIYPCLNHLFVLWIVNRFGPNISMVYRCFETLFIIACCFSLNRLLKKTRFRVLVGAWLALESDSSPD